MLFEEKLEEENEMKISKKKNYQKNKFDKLNFVISIELITFFNYKNSKR